MGVRIDWLPILEGRSSLKLRVGSEFPNLLYYQDNIDKMIGGVIVVRKYIKLKNKEKCSTCDDNSVDSY